MIDLKTEVINFLSAFYDLKYEPIYFRLLDDPKSGDIFKQKHDADDEDLNSVLNFLYEENKKKRGVFFVVNGGGHTDDEVQSVKAQFVDMDKGTKEEQYKMIQEFALTPSIVVETQKGHHVYWLMKNADINLFREYQRRLVLKFNGDSACVNLARVMRIPGFFHCKDKDNPFRIKLNYLNPELIYTQSELNEHLPKVEKENTNTFTLPNQIITGDRNNTLFKLGCSLQKKGLSDKLIDIIVKETNLTQCKPPLEDDELSTVIKQVLNYQKGSLSNNKNVNPEKEYFSVNFVDLERDKNGNIVRSIENFLRIMRADDFFKNIKFNLLSSSPEKTINNVVLKWTDTDDAKAKHHIEAKYKIHHNEKYHDAIRIFFTENEYHPVKNLIESIKWDGVSRIYDFLEKWTKCESSNYSKEVSRLIFAGGIHRIYNPGCKFDDVPVLIGTKQGEGKSTLVEWIALKKDFFGEVSEIEGQKGIEALDGLWICEIAEMLATTKAKEVEAVKAYITRQNDRYRKPFERRTSEHPRQCIFIGTTNKRQFLTDKTGNRRFYPVEVNQTGYDLFNNEKEIKEYIKQCWAEALYLFKKNELKPYANRDLISEIRNKQFEAVEDDYREGMIEKYLEEKTSPYEVCCIELYQEALDNKFSKPTRKESNEITLIMQNFPKWVKQSKPAYLGGYGKQLYWKLEKEPKIDSLEDFYDIISEV